MAQLCPGEQKLLAGFRGHFPPQSAPPPLRTLCLLPAVRSLPPLPAIQFNHISSSYSRQQWDTVMDLYSKTCNMIPVGYRIKLAPSFIRNNIYNDKVMGKPIGGESYLPFDNFIRELSTLGIPLQEMWLCREGPKFSPRPSMSSALQIRHFPNIVKLQCEQYYAKDADLGVIADNLHELRFLSLSLHQSVTQKTGLVRLKDIETLERFLFSSNCISDKRLGSLIQYCLREMPHLKSIGNDSVQGFVHTFSVFKVPVDVNLEELRLASDHVPPVHVNFTRVKALNLTRCDQNSFEQLPRFEQVIVLTLSGYCATEIVDILQVYGHKLEKLIVNDIQIMWPPLALQDVLKQCPTLQVLHLENFNPLDKLEMCREMYSLTELDLSFYRDYTAVTDGFFPALMRLPALKTLSLRGARVDDDDLRNVMDMLQHQYIGSQIMSISLVAHYFNDPETLLEFTKAVLKYRPQLASLTFYQGLLTFKEDLLKAVEEHFLHIQDKRFHYVAQR